jgi:hypothetical protein
VAKHKSICAASPFLEGADGDVGWRGGSEGGKGCGDKGADPESADKTKHGRVVADAV